MTGRYRDLTPSEKYELLRTPEVQNRFWPKVRRSDGCWIWTASRDTHGYGHLGVKGSLVLAHRMAYQLAYGLIPDGLQIDHLCFERSCVNPSHLRAVTESQNREHLRGVRRNSTSGVRGVNWSKAAKKWCVRVQHDKQRIWVGLFSDLEEAERAAIAMRSILCTHDDYHAWLKEQEAA